VLAYDGSESSVHAIRQFAYLFPDLCAADTLLVYASDEDESIPDQSFMEELISRHFPKLKSFKINLDPRRYFDAWIGDRQNSILVCGSFGRSRLSRFLKSSFAAQEIADHKLPVFVAHL
jgi:hypothetical protein